MRYKVIIMKRLPLREKFLAISLCGLIFSRSPLSRVELNHELIHVAQQRELLYLPFFIWYVAEWLLLLCKYRDMEKAYLNIRFEQEAYRHERDLDYLSNRRHYCYH